MAADTGIDRTHPDLQNVVGGAMFVTLSRPGIFGTLFGGSTDGDIYQDRCNHGTHVAGTIAALNQGSGLVGVAPGARHAQRRLQQLHAEHCRCSVESRVAGCRAALQGPLVQGRTSSPHCPLHAAADHLSAGADLKWAAWSFITLQAPGSSQ